MIYNIMDTDVVCLNRNQRVKTKYNFFSFKEAVHMVLKYCQVDTQKKKSQVKFLTENKFKPLCT